MDFPKAKVIELLAQCHRRCCICHRFCGVKIETDHIVPIESGGKDDIENAIPVCFECHAEIHSYNDKHPRGRKFQPDELRLHREQWLKICDERPEVLVGAIRNADVGPLQALIDELDFNATVAAEGDFHRQGCKFHEQQFLRAIHEGSISLLRDSIKAPLCEAYRAMGSANAAIDGKYFQGSPESSNAAQRLICEASPKIKAAKDELLKFLSNETGSEPTP
ncbi:MAG: HNH endonuclease signature motif containing protein [Terracidiphilus sp.]